MSTIGLFVHRVARPLEELTGIGRYAVELSHHLVERGRHDYVLVAPFDDDPAPGIWPDVPIVRVGGVRQVLQLRWRLTRSPCLDDLVPGLDLVHAVSPIVPVPTRVPLVATIHDLFPFDVPEWKSRRGRWLFFAAIDHIRDDATAVITPSTHVRDDVRARVGIDDARLHVVPEGVAPRFHAAERGPAVEARLGLDGDYLLALGSISARKNLGLVVEALARLPASRRPVLALAGPDRGGADALRERAAALGVGGALRWLGFLDDVDVPAVVAGARALVQPSLDEGFGLPVAEALAAGTPVLAARSGALPELVGDAGVLLAADDVDAWASALAELDDADEERARRRARGRAAHLTWEAAAEATEAVYDQALRVTAATWAPA